jgi:membrane fusion protein, peptide pheromone/bacteriocin exporter
MTFSTDPHNNLENLIAKNKTKSLSIYLVVVLCVAVFLCLLPVIQLDISSQSRGMVRAKTDNVPVAVLVNGKVAFINLKNNTAVNKGDTLIKIAKDAIETDKRVQDTLQETALLQLQDVSHLLLKQTDSLKTHAAREDFFQYQARKQELQSKVSQAQINFNRYKILFNKGVIAKAEYEKYLFELRYCNDLLQSFEKQQKSTWENQKRDLEERTKNIDGTIKKLVVEQNNYVVLAPISGTIEQFAGLQVGSIATAGQAIASISPSDNLIVECTVSPNDIGLIHKNQAVKFQIDAFNYNQWGLLQGKVIDIDKNITIQSEKAFFKVRCNIESPFLKLKSGYKTQITKGMTLTTRYYITNRSLFDLLFDKVDDWLNPKNPQPLKGV